MNKFAIVGIGGKQYSVKEGDQITVEKIAKEPNETIKLNHVFLIADGEKVEIGTPLLEKASIEAKVIETKKGDKVRVFKMKRRKRYRKERGHRQIETKIEIVKIVG